MVISHAVAMSLPFWSLVFIFECFRRFGEKFCSVSLGKMASLLHHHMGNNYGPGPMKHFNHRENPFWLIYFNLLMKKQTDKQWKFYWKLTPVRMMFEKAVNANVGIEPTTSPA